MSSSNIEYIQYYNSDGRNLLKSDILKYNNNHKIVYERDRYNLKRLRIFSAAVKTVRIDEEHVPCPNESHDKCTMEYKCVIQEALKDHINHCKYNNHDKCTIHYTIDGINYNRNFKDIENHLTCHVIHNEVMLQKDYVSYLMYKEMSHSIYANLGSCAYLSNLDTIKKYSNCINDKFDCVEYTIIKKCLNWIHKYQTHITTIITRDINKITYYKDLLKDPEINPKTGERSLSYIKSIYNNSKSIVINI